MKKKCRHPKAKRQRVFMKDKTVIETCAACGAKRTGYQRWIWHRFAEPKLRIAMGDA